MKGNRNVIITGTEKELIILDDVSLKSWNKLLKCYGKMKETITHCQIQLKIKVIRRC